MMQSGSGAAIAAVFAEARRAHGCLDELRRQGFNAPWLAIAKAATGDRTTAMAGSSDATAQHDVATSSDGVMGTLGRFFSGDTTLRRSLVDHGVSETIATEIDASLPFGGAVIVVSAGERADLAASILSRAGADVHGAATGFGTPLRSTDAADTAAAGTGSGASTGFLSDAAAREDPDIAGSGDSGHTFYAQQSSGESRGDARGPGG